MWITRYHKPWRSDKICLCIAYLPYHWQNPCAPCETQGFWVCQMCLGHFMTSLQLWMIALSFFVWLICTSQPKRESPHVRSQSTLSRLLVERGEALATANGCATFSEPSAPTPEMRPEPLLRIRKKHVLMWSHVKHYCMTLYDYLRHSSASSFVAHIFISTILTHVATCRELSSDSSLVNSCFT